jgi:hypothetical protein
VFDYPQWLKEQDVQFDDVIPSTDKKTVGDALREGLRGDEHAAAINDRLDKMRDAQTAQSDAIKDLVTDVDTKFGKVLDLLKAL